MGNARWQCFRSVYLETDLWIAVDADHYTPSIEQFSEERIAFYRKQLGNHIISRPEFLSSLVPLEEQSGYDPLIHNMYAATTLSGTGPMSSVAGAVAECICNDLCEKFGLLEAVVENGGDIFMKLARQAVISVYAGNSPLSGKLGFVIEPENTPLSVCCSSATVGHSLSFGTADACVIICRSGALADAYATACCNEVKSYDMIQHVTESYLGKQGVISVMIIKDDKVAMGGATEVTLI